MILQKINKIIRILILSDLYIISGFGFVAPIFAIFIMEQIKGGDVKVAGFAAAIYWIVKSILQIPIGIILDKHKGEKDDFYFLVIGIIISGLVPIGYIFSYLPIHIYLLEVIYAIGMALAIPAWGGIFTRHIDKGKEATEWSVESTVLGIGTGISGAIGGLFVAMFGFKILFVIVSIFVILGGLIPLLIYKEIDGKIEKKKELIIGEEQKYKYP